MPSSTISIKVNGQWDGAALQKAVRDLESFGGAAKKAASLYTSNAQRLAVQAASTEKSISQAFTNGATDMVRFGNELQDVGQKAQDVGRKLTESLTVPMLAVGTYSGAMAVQYDTSMANVRKVTDMTEAELQRLGDAALELSTTQPVTASQILNIEALGAQLGVADDKLQSFSMTVNGLDIATDMNAEQAGKEMAQFANIVDMSDDSFQNYGSTLVALGNNLATTESQISTMSLRLAAAGDIAGMSEADILGMSGAMSSLGIRAEAGGSAMTTIMSKISKAAAVGGADLEAFASVAGMSAEEFAAAWESNPMDALIALLDGIHQLDESGQDMNVTLSEMGINEIRQSDAMRRLANNTDVLKDAVDLANTAWEENSALTNEVDQRNESMASRLQTLKNKVDEIAINVGGPLVEAFISALDACQPLIDAVADAARAFADADEGTQQMVIGLAGIAAGAGPALNVMGKLTSGAGGLVSALGHAGQDLGVYIDALNTTDGAQVRTYQSADTLASRTGLLKNEIVKAAGSADDYVAAWEACYDSQKRGQEISKKLVSLRDAESSATGKAADKIHDRIAALAAESAECEATYNSNRKLLDGWAETASKASGAKVEVTGLGSSFKDAAEAAGDMASSSGKSATALETVKGGASLAATGIASFVKEAAMTAGVSLAIGLVVAAIGDLAMRAQQAEEEERRLAEASMTFGDMAQAAAGDAEAQALGIESISESADKAIDGLIELNQQTAETLQGLANDSASLESFISIIDDLTAKSSLNATEQERLAAAVAGYNEITGSTVEVVDAATGKLSESTDELHENADAWLENAQAQAYQEMAVGYIEKQTEAQIGLTKAQEHQAEVQQKYDAAVRQMNREIDENGTYTAETAAEVERLSTELSEAKDAVNKYSTDLDSSTESLDGIITAQALLRDDVQATKAALEGFGDGFTGSLSNLGISIDELSVKLTDAGISTEELNAIGSENISALASSVGGDIDAMTWAISTYGTSLDETAIKTAASAYSIRNELANMSNAGGMDLDALSTKLAEAGISTTDLKMIGSANLDLLAQNCGYNMDSMIAAIQSYNDKEMPDKESEATVNGNAVDGRAKTGIDGVNSATSSMQSRDVSVNVYGNFASSSYILSGLSSTLSNMPRNVTTYVSQIISKREKADGGIRLHADGGVVVPRYHAGGAIARKAVPLDIVGEDGAEAIVPLTNRRYSQPFADIIAEGFVKRLSEMPRMRSAMDLGTPVGRAVPAQVTYSLNIDGVRFEANSTVMDALRTIFNEYNLTSDMGVM